jgi:hypothetical protein
MTVTTEPAEPTDPTGSNGSNGSTGSTDAGGSAAPADGARPSSAPTARVEASASRPTSRLVLIVACGFLLVLEAAIGVAYWRARADNQALRDQLDQQVGGLDDQLNQLDATRQRLAALQADTGGRQHDIDTGAQLSTVRQVESVELTTQLNHLTDKVKDLQTSVQQNHNLDQTQVQNLLLLTQCLDGIKVADGAIAQGDTQGTIAALKGVTTVCEQTLQIIAPSDNADFPFDFADPSVIYGNDTKYYAYATNAAAGNVQVLSSQDLKKWTLVGGTLDHLPGWAAIGNTWAPSVFQTNGTYYMYYAAGLASSPTKHCISVATSSHPDGGFVDTSAAPLMCDLDKGGVIDPAPFVSSDGSVYLLWKSEGETPQGGGGSALLWSRKLGADFKSFDGDAHAILGVDRAWEGRTVEGPSMAEAGGKFYLFYSGNRFDTGNYAEGWAVCDAPIGPCVKPANNILLQSHDAIAGPGGGEVFVAPGGQLFIAYHAWTAPYIGYLYKRQLHVDKLNVVGGAPQVTDVS